MMDIGLIHRQFLTCYPLKDMKWTKAITTESMQQDIIAATIRSDVVSTKPVAKSYLSAFMKLLMAKIEEYGGEIYDVTFEAYGDILTLPESEVTYKHYNVRDKLISLQETNQLNEGTTGLKTWQASQYLAEFILHNPHIVLDRNLLELGCGVGFLGLALCSNLKCSSYILTDHHETVLRGALANIRVNESSLQCVPKVENIDWEEVHSNGLTYKQTEIAKSSQVILAADVLFEPKLFPALIGTLKSILTHMPDDSCAYIAAAMRNEETFSTFIQTLDSQDVTHETISSTAPKLFLYDDLCKIQILRIKIK